LKGSVEFLCERLQNAQSSRPLIDGLNPKELKDYIEKKMLEREAFYALANYTVSAISCNADEIAAVVKTEQIK
jgi:shikimate kinase